MKKLIFKVKPEYQGAHHVLEVSQVCRKAKPAQRSAAALAAIKEFEDKK